MDSATGNRLVFQRQDRPSGGIEYRINFGRQKVAVMQQSEKGHFYVNMYDNRPKFKGRLLFGFDEAEELLRIITEMGALKPTFENEPEQPARVIEVVGDRPPPPYTANPERHVLPYTAEPYNSTGVLGENNRGEDGRHGNLPVKKRKVRITEESENQIPTDFLDFLTQPF